MSVTSDMVLTSAPPAREAPTRPTLKVERRLWRSGHEVVAGIDEVGRGAWAGPISVGVAVVHRRRDDRRIPTWLRDSKLVPEARREAVFEDLRHWCADYGVGHASAEECDRLGMTLAQAMAARRALEALNVGPDVVVMDGPRDFLSAGAPAGWRAPAIMPIIKADATCAAVSAASLLAKVTRDRLMRREAEHFTLWEFERNKGYPSPEHLRALAGWGCSSIHRRSWAFVDNLLFGRRFHREPPHTQLALPLADAAGHRGGQPSD